jgi:hypothetical protein
MSTSTTQPLSREAHYSRFTKLTAVCCLAFPGILLPLAAQSDIYQSVDEHGNVIFTDSPASGDSAELIKTDAEIKRENRAMGISNQRSTAQRHYLKGLDSRREKEKKAEAKAKKKADKKAAKCAKLKARMKHRERVNRLVTYSKDGDVKYLSDEERKAADQMLAEKTREACGK